MFNPIVGEVSANGPFKDRQDKQAELNLRCEQARQSKLAPIKKRLVEECVAKKKKERSSCERYYADYGGGSRIVFPLFYDLRECIRAEEYSRSYRR